MAFRCVVVTPEQQVMDLQVKQTILPAHDGQMGILSDRAPLLVKLGLGPLTVHGTDGKRSVYFVDGGVAQMKENVLTIATTEATPVEELSVAQAEAQFVYRLQTVGGFGGKSDQLNAYHVFVGDPGFFDRDLQRYTSATRQTLQQAAAACLGTAHRVTLSVVPRGRLDLAAPDSSPAVVQ